MCTVFHAPLAGALASKLMRFTQGRVNFSLRLRCFRVRNRVKKIWSDARAPTRMQAREPSTHIHTHTHTHVSVIYEITKHTARTRERGWQLLFISTDFLTYFLAHIVRFRTLSARVDRAVEGCPGNARGDRRAPIPYGSTTGICSSALYIECAPSSGLNRMYVIRCALRIYIYIYMKGVKWSRVFIFTRKRCVGDFHGVLISSGAVFGVGAPLLPFTGASPASLGEAIDEKRMRGRSALLSRGPQESKRMRVFSMGRLASSPRRRPPGAP